MRPLLKAMAAHRQLPPPHWLPQAPCTPASICAPVAARLTHNSLRGMPLHASRFLRQRSEQLGQAAARGAGCCDASASAAVRRCAQAMDMPVPAHMLAGRLLSAAPLHP